MRNLSSIILLSAKHNYGYPNSLKHRSWDSFSFVTSPLINFRCHLAVILPPVQALVTLILFGDSKGNQKG